jgi:hypothetical protein
MPNDLLKQPLRGNHREYAPRAVQRTLKRFGFQQPERHIDRCANHPVLIAMDLTGMHRQPQPDPSLSILHPVVLHQRRSQLLRNNGRHNTLRHVWWNQHQHPITTVLVVTVPPTHPSSGKRLPQRPVQPLSDRNLMRICSATIPESLDINTDDRPMHRRGQPIHHTTLLVAQHLTLTTPAQLHSHPTVENVLSFPRNRDDSSMRLGEPQIYSKVGVSDVVDQ